MSASQPIPRRDFPAPAPLVIAETEDGYQVYSPARPREVFQVSGTPDAPTCTCPDFQDHADVPAFRCVHIEAVLPLRSTEPGTNEDDEERRAIQDEGAPATRSPNGGDLPPGGTQMLLKRSVSPDGRIDALSVEFSTPVNGAPARDIVERATRILRLQGQIAQRFLHPAPASPSTADEQAPDLDRAVPAKLLSIGGMDGKWGRRLFIIVQLNGHTVRIFGSPKQLAVHIAAAGFPELGAQVVEGARLMLACRVITRPGKDPRYVEIEQVLPAERPKPQGLRRA